jgi:rubrerythrin
MLDRLTSALTAKFTRQLVLSPEGRARMLAQCAEAEDNGESRLFDRLLEKVDDARLQGMIRRHQQDEVRHGELFRACAARAGVTVPPVPDHLKIADRIDRALNGIFQRPVQSNLDVMEAYLLLQVLEERAVSQFPLFQAAFRDVDPHTAETFAEVARDEDRHLKYCHAISKRYAPDEATRLATLKHFRAVEAKAFADNSRANMEAALEGGYVAAGPFGRAFWRAVRATVGGLQTAQYTRFSTLPATATA